MTYVIKKEAKPIKETLLNIFPYYWIIIAVLDLIYAGAYASGYKTEHKGWYWSIMNFIAGCANLGIALIFLLNL